jgi:hypothetical protein
MAREEFNREMGDYLRRRNVIKRTNPFAAAHNFFTKSFKFTIKREEKEELPLDIPPEQVEAVLAQDAIRQTTSKRPAAGKPQVVTIPQQEPKQPEKKTMGWLFNKKKEDEDYDTMETVQVPAQAALDEDVKEVLKITFKWLKQMDPEQVEQIKSSPDFEKYKKVLDKYGLIKK